MQVTTFPLVAGSNGDQIVLEADAGVPGRPHIGAPDAGSQLGYCLVAPFTWGSRGDFVAAGGLQLIRAVIRAIIGTRCSAPSGSNPGEISWRPQAGSLVDLLRHLNVDDPATQALARLYVAQAVQTWDPRIVIQRVGCSRIEVPGQGTGLKTTVIYAVRASGARGAATLVQEDKVEHTVST